RIAGRGLPLVGLDSGTFAIAQAGLMEGYRAVVHWRHLGEYVSRFPNSPAVNDQLWLVDRDRVSCPGGAAAIELAVALLTRHCGRHRALKGMADLQVEGPRAQANLSHDLGVEDTRLNRAIELMQGTLAQPITCAKLAQKVGLSVRQLDRLFQNHFNQTARSYYMQIRCQQARWLVEHSNKSFGLIADQTGFCDSAHLLRNFRAQFGETPGSLRRQAQHKLSNGVRA
ncbi:MAG: GlxA family transcriptional regulator, partial [Granulosicoccaceae bacterium]